MSALRDAIEALPHHTPGGYEWEWMCSDEPTTVTRTNRDGREMQWAEWCQHSDQHDDDLISRKAVLALLSVNSSVTPSGDEPQ